MNGKGENVAVVPEDEMVDTLVEWAEFINAEGMDAALARAVKTRDEARRAAEEDRLRNLNERGDDANASEQVVELLRSQR